MLFNSHTYILFLLIVITVIFFSRLHARVYLLGFFSIAFYAFWRWDFAFLILLSAVTDFTAARCIHATSLPGRRKFFLILSLVVNLGLLVFFKYSNFLFENIMTIGQVSGLANEGQFNAFDIILPLGISFYTFQTISYTIDVYRGVIVPSRHFFVFLTYVSFWPQLIAGPILRAGEIIPQLEHPTPPSRDVFLSGIHRIIIGLFKKVVLADNLAIIVDGLFAREIESLDFVSANQIWLAAFLFGFQIYLDFSAYSDIAIGSARLVGIKFPENFNWPYLAKSPRDFWARWHISLSSWIRDYLYLPMLGKKSHIHSTGGIATGMKHQTNRRTWALLVTWVIMGLWHGAHWNFVLWGLYHAIMILGHRLITRVPLSLFRLPDNAFIQKARTGISWGVTLFLMMAGWIFFRAESVDKSMAMMERLVTPSAYLPYPTSNIPDYFTAVGMVLCMLLAHRARGLWSSLAPNQTSWPMNTLQVVYYGILTSIILLFLTPVRAFIYFQF